MMMLMKCIRLAMIRVTHRLTKGIQGQLNMFSRGPVIFKNGMPWNRSRLNMPHITAGMTAKDCIFLVKKASMNMASKGPVNSPVKNKAFLSREPC